MKCIWEDEFADMENKSVGVEKYISKGIRIIIYVEYKNQAKKYYLKIKEKFWGKQKIVLIIIKGNNG